MEQTSMSKVLRTLLGGSAFAAVLGAVLFGFAGVFGAQQVEAQSPPTPPSRFAGTVTLNGAPVLPGTVVSAMIGSASCGSTATFTEAGVARYVLDVPALEPAGAPNCGTDGAVVSFFIGSVKANETGAWRNFDLNQLNLTASSATPTASPSASATPTGGGGTPKPPTTGSGGTSIESGSDTNWLFLALGVGAVALAAGGAVVVRRSR
jgi:hypothetical protein